MENQAAYITALNTPLEIRSTPYTLPGDNEILIRTHAVAINPIDAAFQTIPNLFPWLSYPIIPGVDVTGEVIHVGSAVTRFQRGDRVLGAAAGGTRQPTGSMPETGFQRYTILKAALTAPIPAHISYVQASVIPLGMCTVASAMFQKDFLGLRLPSVSGAGQPDSKELLLVWGGSSSLGCNAIQLAVAAGYEVVTTCSPRNFGLVKRLGASYVFDYNVSTVVEDVVRVFEGRISPGVLAITQGSVEPCAQVAGRVDGRKFVASASRVEPGQEVIGEVQVKFVFGSSLEHTEVGPAMFEDYIPRALAEGKFVPAPEARVVGKGLESCQEALDIMKEGVSACKLVVDLSD